MYHYCKG